MQVHDDRKLFEFMVLDTFQAGLSWNTVLNKRENFRKAFDNFQPESRYIYEKEDSKAAKCHRYHSNA
jgi:DNA-3-methyladenine glycosylase I